VLIAKAQFHSMFGLVNEGDAYPADAPVVRAFPSMFCSPDDYAALKTRKTVTFGPGSVEQASAAPGEKRHTRRPAK
jgi:hypothetical protein